MSSSSGQTPDSGVSEPMVRPHGGRPEATSRSLANLVMESGGALDRTFQLRPGSTTIGRDGRCDVRIALPKVSPRHCEIVLENKRATLLSKDDTIGTLLNGKLVKEAPLAHDDEVQIGPVTFRVILQPDDAC